VLPAGSSKRCSSSSSDQLQAAASTSRIGLDRRYDAALQEGFQQLGRRCGPAAFRIAPALQRLGIGETEMHVGNTGQPRCRLRARPPQPARRDPAAHPRCGHAAEVITQYRFGRRPAAAAGRQDPNPARIASRSFSSLCSPVYRYGKSGLAGTRCRGAASEKQHLRIAFEAVEDARQLPRTGRQFTHQGIRLRQGDRREVPRRPRRPGGRNVAKGRSWSLPARASRPPAARFAGGLFDMARICRSCADWCRTGPPAPTQGWPASRAGRRTRWPGCPGCARGSARSSHPAACPSRSETTLIWETMSPAFLTQRIEQRGLQRDARRRPVRLPDQRLGGRARYPRSARRRAR
jgi:hypothetical protein